MGMPSRACSNNDCKILRAFKGRSKLTTFLTTVVSRLCLDYIDKERGRWRTSAEAERLGPVAIGLEKLIYRDGYPIGEAIDELMRRQPSLVASDLHRTARQLPLRPDKAAISLDQIGPAIAGSESDPVVSALERHRFRHLLGTLIGDLPHQDQAMLRLRYEEEVTMAEIARLFSVEPRLLYRRFEQVKLKLRSKLEQRGIDGGEANDLLDEGGL